MYLRFHMALLAALILVHSEARGTVPPACDCAPGCDACPGCQAYFDALGGEGGPTAGESPQAAPYSSALSDTSLLAADFGATAGARGAVPSMIGDFFGNGYRFAFTTQRGNGYNNNNNGTTVATAGGDRRFKYAENTSPFPTDRVFFNYHMFDDPLFDIDGRSRDLSRFTFGVEKTFCNQLGSIELRVPFAAALDGNQDLMNPSGMGTQFGNMSLAAKILLHRSRCGAVAAGLGIVFPTGEDAVVTQGQQTEITFENSSVYLQPFVGFYHAPGERLFQQFLFQLDFDVNGSDVIVPPDSFLSFNRTEPEVSRLQSQSLLFLDYQVGYWLRRNRQDRILTGVAPLLELHYTSTLQDQDYGAFAGRGIFIEDLRRDVLNLTAGMYLELCHDTSVKFAAAAPLLDDRAYNYELGLQIVHRY